MDYSNISDDKIGAIIVLYNPDIPQLVTSLILKTLKQLSIFRSWKIVV